MSTVTGFALAFLLSLASCAASSKPGAADASPDSASSASDAAAGLHDSSRLDDSGPNADALAAVPVNLTGTCTDTGWCWQRPRPQGNYLYDLWAGAEDNVWAVGIYGTIIHWDGQTWTSKAIPGVHDDFDTVWGMGSEVWVGGTGGTYHWKNNAWKRELGEADRALAIFGNSLTNIWMATEWTGVVRHYSSQGWGEINLPWSTDLCSAGWTSGPNDVWFACDKLTHYDGTTFNRTDFYADKVVGTSPTDVWGVRSGSNSVIHWDGNAWTTVAPVGELQYNDSLVALWPRTPTDVWILSTFGGLQRFDGSQWSTVRESTSGMYKFLTGVGPTTMWMGGYNMSLFRGDGYAFTDTTESTDSLVLAVWAADANTAWAGTDNGILKKEGAGWVNVPGTAGQRYQKVWGSGPADVWFMQADGTLKYWGGASFADVARPSGYPSPVVLTSSGPTNVWEVDAKVVYHWDGSQWSTISFRSGSDGGVLAGVVAAWTSGPSELWMVDSGGTLYHWDGNAFSTSTLGRSVRAVWGTPPSDLWAVSGGNSIYHWDGQTWTSYAITPPANSGGLGFSAIAGVSNTNVWAVSGAGGFAYHWDGKNWTAYLAYIFGTYSSLAVTPDGGAFMVGDTDAIMYHAPL